MKNEHFRALYLAGYKRQYNRGKTIGLHAREQNSDQILDMHRDTIAYVQYLINHRKYSTAAFNMGIADGLGNSELEGVVERLMPT